MENITYLMQRSLVIREDNVILRQRFKIQKLFVVWEMLSNDSRGEVEQWRSLKLKYNFSCVEIFQPECVRLAHSERTRCSWMCVLSPSWTTHLNLLFRTITLTPKICVLIQPTAAVYIADWFVSQRTLGKNLTFTCFNWSRLGFAFFLTGTK